MFPIVSNLTRRLIPSPKDLTVKMICQNVPVFLFFWHKLTFSELNLKNMISFILDVSYCQQIPWNNSNMLVHLWLSAPSPFWKRQKYVVYFLRDSIMVWPLQLISCQSNRSKQCICLLLKKQDSLSLTLTRLSNNIRKLSTDILFIHYIIRWLISGWSGTTEVVSYFTYS